MLSDDLDRCAEYLALAQELGEPLTPERCGLLARAIRACAGDARAIERHPLWVVPQVAPEITRRHLSERSNVLAFPRRFRCVTPDGGAA